MIKLTNRQMAEAYTMYTITYVLIGNLTSASSSMSRQVYEHLLTNIIRALINNESEYHLSVTLLMGLMRRSLTEPIEEFGSILDTACITVLENGKRWFCTFDSPKGLENLCSEPLKWCGSDRRKDIYSNVSYLSVLIGTEMGKCQRNLAEPELFEDKILSLIKSIIDSLESYLDYYNPDSLSFFFVDALLSSIPTSELEMTLGGEILQILAEE